MAAIFHTFYVARHITSVVNEEIWTKLHIEIISMINGAHEGVKNLFSDIRLNFYKKLQLLFVYCDQCHYEFTNSPQYNSILINNNTHNNNYYDNHKNNVNTKADDEDVVYIELYESQEQQHNAFATNTNKQHERKYIIRLISLNKLLQIQFQNSKSLHFCRQMIAQFLQTCILKYIIKTYRDSTKKTLQFHKMNKNLIIIKKLQIITTTTITDGCSSTVSNLSQIHCKFLFNNMNVQRQVHLLPKLILHTLYRRNLIYKRKYRHRYQHWHFMSILQRVYLLLILLSTFWHKSECFHGNFKQSTNIVKTKYGLVRGIVLHSSPLVEAYLGIPYATPPVGSLRFMPPITPSSWKNVRVADRFSAACPQVVPVPPNGPEALLEVPRARLAQLRRLSPLLKNQSEDCLYLNIYAPYDEQKRHVLTKSSEFHNSTTTKRKSLSTILFIHGESYDWNSGNPYDGSELAANGNVIVVTINFRLGILGFLKTGGKESAQGNFGLMDLVAGLHWLKENLPAFGGDPQSITLIGHGTGAALANILVVSPVSSDLVQRVVLASGSALSPWALQRNPLFVKRRVAEQTGCHGDMLFDDLAPCLRTKTVQELLSVKIDHPRFLVGFAPFVDGTVIHTSSHLSDTVTIPTTSTIASTSGIEFANFPKRDLIFCLTSVESYLDLSAQDLEFGFNETRRDRILRTFVRNNFHYHLNEIFAILKNEYTDWEKAIRNPLSSRDATLAFLSDGHTASTLIKLAYMHSLRGGHSYFLHFKHKTAEEEYPQRAGSVRGEDVPFWLGLPSSPLFPHNYTTEEKQLSHLMVTYLANFAKTGNPNQSSHTSEIPSNTPIAAAYTSNSIIDGTHYTLEMTKRKRSSSGQMQKALKSIGNVKNSSMSLAFGKEHSVTTPTTTATSTADAATIEMIHLAVIYNQRRSNALRERRIALKRHMRSNNNNDYQTVENNQQANVVSTIMNPPFWDAYDAVNQLYLEIGTYTVVQSHYRGHKLSMWLNLIPQLHLHFNINEQSMRHHQFQDTMNNKDLYYEGVVRPQLQSIPIEEKDDIAMEYPKIKLQTTVAQSENKQFAKNITTITTECNVEVEITTQPSRENNTVISGGAGSTGAGGSGGGANGGGGQKDMATASTGLIGNIEILRRLGGKHFQSYTTALIATVAVGCFLLVLNILIFAGIYHQREKRVRDTKKREDVRDNSDSSSLMKQDNSSKDKEFITLDDYQYYDEKSIKQFKTNQIVMENLTNTIDASSTVATTLDIDWNGSTKTVDLLKVNPSYIQTDMHTQDNHNIQEILDPLQTFDKIMYSNASGNVIEELPLHSSKAKLNLDVASHLSHGPSIKLPKEISFDDVQSISKCPITNKGEQRCLDDDDDDIPEPPPPPRLFQAAAQQQQPQQATIGGILRQTNTNSGPQTANSRKRVHIKEISV